MALTEDIEAELAGDVPPLMYLRWDRLLIRLWAQYHQKQTKWTHCMVIVIIILFLKKKRTNRPIFSPVWQDFEQGKWNWTRCPQMWPVGLRWSEKPSKNIFLFLFHYSHDHYHHICITKASFLEFFINLESLFTRPSYVANIA